MPEQSKQNTGELISSARVTLVSLAVLLLEERRGNKETKGQRETRSDFYPSRETLSAN